MEEESKAVAEIAKATGKAIDAVRDFGEFVAGLIRGPLSQAVGIIHDRLTFIRFERALRLRDRYVELLRERGLTGPTRAIPIKVVIPLIEEGSLEEDDSLQDVWAALLVNAADAGATEVRRMHVSLLSEMSSLDVQVLAAIYSVPAKLASKGIWTRDLPGKALLEKPSGEYRPNTEIDLSVDNLLRLRCLSSAMAWGGMEAPACVYPTALGRSLFEACSGPKTVG